MSEAKRRMVVVDASADTLELLEEFFGEAGYEVTRCAVAELEPGEKLADRVAASDPDVVVYDIDMPYAASWLTALTTCFDERVRCPFVFTTTNARIARQLMADVTHAAIVEKPYALETLRVAVEQAAASYVRPAAPETPGDRRQRQRRRGDRRQS